MSNGPSKNIQSHIYPLKIYISPNNDVVVTYTGAFYKDFVIQDVTFIIEKKRFYKIIEELNQRKFVKIVDNDMYIKVEIFKKECKVTVGDSKNNAISVEKDMNFAKWLLSIDLRKSKRINAMLPISVHSTDIFEYGAIQDISETGFKIALNSHIPNNSMLTINIFDEEYPIGNIYCQVKSIQAARGKYIYGVNIEGISSIDEIKLKRLIERETIKNLR